VLRGGDADGVFFVEEEMQKCFPIVYINRSHLLRERRRVSWGDRVKKMA
jgi:hypothetical protein